MEAAHLKQIGAKVIKIRPESYESLKDRLNRRGLLEGVIIPSECPEEPQKNLFYCLMADLNVFILTEKNVDNVYFSLLKGNYSLTKKGAQTFLGKQTSNISTDMLKVITEAVCQNNGKPIWTEGYKVDRLYYFMVLLAVEPNSINLICGDTDAEAPMLADPSRAIKEMNQIRAKTAELRGLLASKMILRDAEIKERAKVADKAKSLLFVLELAESKASEDDIAFKEFKKTTLEFLGDLAKEKTFLSAMERAIRDYCADGDVLWEQAEARIHNSPFSDISVGESVMEMVAKTLEGIDPKPSMQKAISINIKPLDYDPVIEPNSLPNARPVNTSVEEEEKKLAEKIKSCLENSEQVPKFLIAEALDLGWSFDFKTNVLKSARYPAALVTGKSMKDFVRSNVYALLRMQGSTSKPKAISLTIRADGEDAELAKRHQESLAMDHHSLSNEGGKVRMIAYLNLEKKEEIERILMGSTAAQFSTHLKAIQANTQRIAPPISEIAAIMCKEIELILWQQISSGGLLATIAKGERYELSEEDQRSCASIFASNLVAEYTKSPRFSQIINGDIKKVISLIILTHHGRRFYNMIGYPPTDGEESVARIYKAHSGGKEVTVLRDYDIISAQGMNSTLSVGAIQPNTHLQMLVTRCMEVVDAIQSRDLASMVKALQPSSTLSKEEKFLVSVAAIPLVSLLCKEHSNFYGTGYLANFDFVFASMFLAKYLEQAAKEIAEEFLANCRSTSSITTNQVSYLPEVIFMATHLICEPNDDTMDRFKAFFQSQAPEGEQERPGWITQMIKIYAKKSCPGYVALLGPLSSLIEGTEVAPEAFLEILKQIDQQKYCDDTLKVNKDEPTAVNHLRISTPRSSSIVTLRDLVSDEQVKQAVKSTNGRTL